MARHASNRDRIDRLRAEADATKKEREERAKERAANPVSRRKSSAKAPAHSGRLKIVWAVKDPDGNIVRTYPYPQQPHAEAEAARLREVHQRYYTVRKEKVPMD